MSWDRANDKAKARDKASFFMSLTKYTLKRIC